MVAEEDILMAEVLMTMVEELLLKTPEAAATKAASSSVAITSTGAHDDYGS
jgi:hypothetical protein